MNLSFFYRPSNFGERELWVPSPLVMLVHLISLIGGACLRHHNIEVPRCFGKHQLGWALPVIDEHHSRIDFSWLLLYKPSQSSETQSAPLETGNHGRTPYFLDQVPNPNATSIQLLLNGFGHKDPNFRSRLCGTFTHQRTASGIKTLTSEVVSVEHLHIRDTLWKPCPIHGSTNRSPSKHQR
jgi:hypothetical protein